MGIDSLLGRKPDLPPASIPPLEDAGHMANLGQALQQVEKPSGIDTNLFKGAHGLMGSSEGRLDPSLEAAKPSPDLVAQGRVTGIDPSIMPFSPETPKDDHILGPDAIADAVKEQGTPALDPLAGVKPFDITEATNPERTIGMDDYDRILGDFEQRQTELARKANQAAEAARSVRGELHTLGENPAFRAMQRQGILSMQTTPPTEAELKELLDRIMKEKTDAVTGITPPPEITKTPTTPTTSEIASTVAAAQAAIDKSLGGSAAFVGKMAEAPASQPTPVVSQEPAKVQAALTGAGVTSS